MLMKIRSVMFTWSCKHTERQNRQTYRQTNRHTNRQRD